MGKEITCKKNKQANNNHAKIINNEKDVHQQTKFWTKNFKIKQFYIQQKKKIDQKKLEIKQQKKSRKESISSLSQKEKKSKKGKVAKVLESKKIKKENINRTRKTNTIKGEKSKKKSLKQNKNGITRSGKVFNQIIVPGIDACDSMNYPQAQAKVTKTQIKLQQPQFPQVQQQQTQQQQQMQESQLKESPGLMEVYKKRIRKLNLPEESPDNKCLDSFLQQSRGSETASNPKASVSSRPTVDEISETEGNLYYSGCLPQFAYAYKDNNIEQKYQPTKGNIFKEPIIIEQDLEGGGCIADHPVIIKSNKRLQFNNNNKNQNNEKLINLHKCQLESMQPIQEYNQKNQQKVKQILLDCVICCDTTQSMGEYLACSDLIVQQIHNMLSCKTPQCEINIKFGFVCYRDHPPEELTYVTKVCDLCNADEVIEFIQNQTAEGGGDVPEAVLDGLQQAVNNISWRSYKNQSSKSSIRYLIHIGDSPPHGDLYTGKGPIFQRSFMWTNGCPCGLTIDKIAKQMNQNKIHYRLIKIGQQLDRMSSIFKMHIKDYKEFPVVCAQNLDLIIAQMMLNEGLSKYRSPQQQNDKKKKNYLDDQFTNNSLLKNQQNQYIY